MKIKNCQAPSFLIDSLPGIPDSECRELLRCVEINTKPENIYVWLKQLRIAPYSFDFIDNRFKKSPGFIIENLPELKINTHFLLVFHILEILENSFIAARFCEPINPPVDLHMKGMYIEYRIVEDTAMTRVWCKLKGFFNTDISSRGFFFIFALANRIMMSRQLKNIKRLSELSAAGKVETRIHDLKNYFIKSGIHWWIFCRRHNCKGIIT